MNRPVPRVRMEIADPVFFATPLRKMTIETNPVVNRTYFLKGERIIAVAVPVERDPRG